MQEDLDYWKDNTWKVQWNDEDGATKFKKFPGNSPRKAVEFGKQLKQDGIVVVDVISMARAFPPPLKRAIAPRMGMLWCPFCIKWREFHEAAVRHGDLFSPVLLRCPVCTISVKHAYVRKYNYELVAQYEIAREMRAMARMKRKEKVGSGFTVRGSIVRSRRRR